jgi:hypothetical protein
MISKEVIDTYQRGQTPMKDIQTVKTYDHNFPTKARMGDKVKTDGRIVELITIDDEALEIYSDNRSPEGTALAYLTAQGHSVFINDRSPTETCGNTIDWHYA